MSRLLFWVALAMLVVFALRAKIRAARRRADLHEQAQQRGAARSAAPLASSETMTSCAHCGLYVPVSEAVRADGRDYCCPAHVPLPAQ